MSLINEALKRATELKKRSGDAPPSLPIRPVNYEPRPGPGFRILMVLALLALLAVGIVFLILWYQDRAYFAGIVPPAAPSPAAASQPPPPPTPEPEAIARPAAAATTAPVASSLPTSPQAAPIHVRILDATDETPVTLATNTDSEVAPATTPAAETNATPIPSVPRFPELRLQSIVYRPSKPAVVINGEMLHIGDVIQEARVVKIDQFSATLEWHGETNVLSLRRL